MCCHDACWHYIVSFAFMLDAMRCEEHYGPHYCLIAFSLPHADPIAVKVPDELLGPRLPPRFSLDMLIPIEAARSCLPLVTPRETY